ncbi:MAG: tetratricopeptide repeat protein [Euryarchaeota archaeon]|nr:tetratricopeptide repeat protein [Euryarchaeota archaeon]
MKEYTEYILGLDVAAVISTIIIFLFGNLQAQSAFMLATQLIFVLSTLALALTFLYYVQVGSNNQLLIPGLVIFGIGAAITFFSWFIGGLVALAALLLLLMIKNIDAKERMGLFITYGGFAILAVMPPVAALLSLSFGMSDIILIIVGLALIIVGIIFTLKVRKSVEVINIGFIFLTLAFLFIAPAHELLGIHANGGYGVYDESIVFSATVTFFIFFSNLVLYLWHEKNVLRDIELGYKFLKKGKYSEAYAHFQKAYKDFPDDERVLNGLGLSLMKMGKYNESEEYLRKLTRLYAGNNTYLTNLGNLYFRSGRIDKAIETYQKVLEREPNFYNALNNLARCYMEKGDYEKAREYLEKAIAVDQDKKAAKVNYYFLLTALGMGDEAKRYKAEIGGLVE